MSELSGNSIRQAAAKEIDGTKMQSIINKFQKESDRACAVLAVATLDALMESLLQRSMIAQVPKDMLKRGPFRVFSAKIDIAYSYGLISAEERDDLHILRSIRNDFAHDLDDALSFDTIKIVEEVRSLHMPKIFAASEFIVKEFNTTRSIFELSVVGLVIIVRDIRTKHAKRPQPLIVIKPMSRRI